MKLKNICILGLLSISILSGEGQNSGGTNIDYSIKAPEFTKLSTYEEMNVVLDKVLVSKPKVTPEYAGDLIRQINEPNASDEGKVYAIYLLGELCITYTNAIETLVNKIGLKAPQIELNLRIRLWGTFPAQEALVKMGMPVVVPILNHLPNEVDQFRRQLLCSVLVLIEGNKNGTYGEAGGKAMAQGQISQMLAAESDSQRQANLELALKEIDKLRTVPRRP
jgi:hypothetical protein